jgi:uncharacterized protein YecT (DUF1311 family)
MEADKRPGLWQDSGRMKLFARGFFVRSVVLSALLLSVNVAAFAQEEKHYRHEDGHEFLDWGQGARGNDVTLEIEGHQLSATLVSDGVDDAGQVVRWRSYLHRDVETVVGKTSLRITEQSVIIKALGDTWGALGIDPSGVYQRLTEADRLRFAKADYAAADAELNRVYGEIRETLKDQPEVWADLRQRQRDWIDYRDYIVSHPATSGTDPDAKQKSISYWDTMAGMTESQTEFLEIFSGESVPDGRDGIYVDARGGQLMIENADAESFDFSISVVRGPTFHLGDVSGKAKIGSDGVAVFVDTEPDAFIDGKPCIIRFELKGKRIQVSGENTMYYHGARAYFDGEFFKQSDLPVDGAAEQ